MPIITAPSPGVASSFWGKTGLTAEGQEALATGGIGVGGRIWRADPSGQPTPFDPGMSIAGKQKLGAFLFVRPGAERLLQQQTGGQPLSQSAVQNAIDAFLSQGFTKTGQYTLEKDEGGLKTFLTIDPETGMYSSVQQQILTSGGGSSAPPVDKWGSLMKGIQSGSTLGGAKPGSTATTAELALANWLYPKSDRGTVGYTDPMTGKVTQYSPTTYATLVRAGQLKTGTPTNTVLDKFAQGSIITTATGQQVMRNIVGVDASGKPIVKDTPITTKTSGTSGLSAAITPSTGSGFTTALYGSTGQTFSATAGAQYIVTDAKTGVSTKVTAKGGENYAPSTKVITSAPASTGGGSSGSSSKSSASVSSPTYTVKTASGATETRQNVGGGYKVVSSTPASKPSSDKKAKSYRLFESAPKNNPLSHFLKGKLPFKW